MVRAWKTLLDAGVPLGAIRRPRKQWSLAAASQAVREVSRRPLAPLEREALFAWLQAFEHHWPTTFEESIGASGRALARKLSAFVTDANRYIKLRRIAIENLSPRL
jgi:hypothetical protein